VLSFAIVFAVTLATTLILTPLVRRTAVRLGAVDIPDDRKVHAEPTPLLGGVAMFLAVLAGTLFGESSEPIGVVLAATVLVVLGVVDDVRGMRAPTKLAGQLLAAGVLVLSGVQLVYFWIPGVGILSLSADLSALLTVIWTIALINAVNLIDGLDGLAVGVTVIAASAFFVYASETSPGAATTAELLTVIVVGTGLGFLRYNFNPARIFMGDAGSMLLGMLLASATVSAIGRTTEPQFIDVAGYVVPALLPLIVIAIPLADAGLAIARRVRGGAPVFHADKRHIHHWLMEMANSHRRAVLVMYLWSTMLAAAALVLALGPGLIWRIVAGVIALGMVASVVVLPRALRSRVS
jgi:UDP-GlcNAc:undecaprenyl-phosphate GlcNAc-1-phosphate transferase